MGDDSAFIEHYFEQQLSKMSLPTSITEKYNLISCMGKREDHASFLVCNKKTAVKYVLKMGKPEYAEQMREEYAQLHTVWTALKEKAYYVEEMAL